MSANFENFSDIFYLFQKSVNFLDLLSASAVCIYREPLKTPVKSKNGQGAPDTRKAGEGGLAPVETD